MANMFECVLASSGTSATITVTYDSFLIGETITLSKGSTSYSVVGDSSLEAEFTVDEEGTWTLSATGTDLTSTVDVIFSYDVEFTFNWETWVDLGGLDHTDYNSLSDVFLDEKAVRRLMTVHASADYLIKWVEFNPDILDPFCADDTAMKWIGLRDYVCDGLTAIDGVCAKFLACDYWERILKDHVPVMTSNTAPYGVASASAAASGYAAYRAFDGLYDTEWTSGSTSGQPYIQYKFVNPICVKRFKIRFRSFASSSTLKISASNDGTNFTDLTSSIVIDGNDYNERNINNTDYYLYYRLTILSQTRPTSSSSVGQLDTLQFYGRSLNVSVPVMTSNTAPYGKVSATSAASGVPAYYVFDNNASTHWGASSTTNQRVEYKFTRPVVITEITIRPDYSSGAAASYKYGRVKNFKVQGSNNGTNWTDIYSGQCSTPSVDMTYTFGFSNTTSYLYYCVLVIDVWTGNTACGIVDLNFYGVDYTEREFAEGSTMKYIYDHGLELVTLNYGGLDGASGIVSNTGDKVFVNSPSSDRASGAYTSSTINLANYSLLRINNVDNAIGKHKSGSNWVGQAGMYAIGYSTTIPTTYGWNGLNGYSSWSSNSANPDAPFNALSLDLSNVNSNAYILVSSGASTSTSGGINLYDFNELWLE